jgi:hypothetical protein
MDENSRKFHKIEYLENWEIDLRRQIGEANKLVKSLEIELEEVTRQKNLLKTELEGVSYFPK